MHTQQTLVSQLKGMGIKPDDTITIHISLKSVGMIDTSEKTGAEVVIDALCESVKDGLLLIPSHTYVNISKIPEYDVRTSVPCIGAVPQVAVEYANRAYECGDRTVMRSLHPDHSVVAFGKTAHEYTEGDRYVKSAMAEGGCYSKLYAANAKILLIGVGLTRCTYIHVIDEYMEGGNISPLTYIKVTDYDGSSSLREARTTRGASSKYGKYLPAIEAAGAVTYGKFGDADVMLCDVVKLNDAICAVWKELN